MGENLVFSSYGLKSIYVYFYSIKLLYSLTLISFFVGIEKTFLLEGMLTYSLIKKGRSFHICGRAS
jgi:hypothetical protein